MSEVKLRVLVRARELILDKENWIIGTMRQRRRGRHPQYCVYGAMRQACVELTGANRPQA